MMLPTFQHWVSFLQYKKIWPAKKKILNSSVSSQKNSYVREITQVKNFQQQLQKQQNIIMFVITTKNINVNGD